MGKREKTQPKTSSPLMCGAREEGGSTRGVRPATCAVRKAFCCPREGDVVREDPFGSTDPKSDPEHFGPAAGSF